MDKFAALLVSMAYGTFLVAQTAKSPEKLRGVDVFLGVDGGGNTTPGAQVPFGFVVLQPDTERAATSGYRSGNRALGFSSTHESGTGGASKYGNFRVMPSIGADQIPVSEPIRDEVGWPGYYATTIDGQGGSIRAELSASRLVGFHRYTFPAVKKATLTIEVSSVIVKWGGGTPQRPVACDAHATPEGGLNGSCKFSGGWNSASYQLFFAAEFDRHPTSTGVNRGTDFWSLKKDGRTDREWEPLWALASFDTTSDPTVQMKLAVSFLSVEKALVNLRDVQTWDFKRAREEAEKQWREALDKIEVDGGTSAERSIFASSLYRAHVMPHDLSGENVWWTSTEPHYEDYYTLWDTFRTQNPLLLVIQPERERDLVRSMIDTYRNTGWMPDARIAGANGITQGGTNGDVLIADAMVKGLTGIDFETAYRALVKNAETDSEQPLLQGREKMSVYKKLGYMPLEQQRSGSRTMEYAADDFAVSEVAEGLGRPEDAAVYRKRSLFWANLWDKDSASIRPRSADGRWMSPFDRSLTTMAWTDPFYEGSPWQYSTYVPHDVQGLVNRTGGDAGFVQWLDDFFAQDKYDPGNEPDMLSAWLYIHAGRPDRTQAVVRSLLQKYYKSGREGLPGNDDAGAMSSWFVWAAMGLYPNAGQPYYYLSSPVFTEVRIDVGQGKKFIIQAPNSSAINQYIQSATLNGKQLDRAWLKHTELVHGGILRLELGSQPSAWGRGERPYSVESRR